MLSNVEGGELKWQDRCSCEWMRLLRNWAFPSPIWKPLRSISLRTNWEPPVLAFDASTGGTFYILSISAKTTACCSSLSLDQRFSNFRWDSVRETGASPSANSWESVIPKAAQIFSRDGIVGIMFLRYQDEMVDWGKPERSASWYSVQPRSSRYVVMAARMSFTLLTLCLCSS